MERYARIMRAVAATPWAIHPDKATAMFEFLERKAAGRTGERAESATKLASPPVYPRMQITGEGVAVIKLRGVIAHRIEQINDISGPGGTSIEMFQGRFREAMTNSRVIAIVLDVDSPGGAVAGVEEMATEIYRSRGGKPIVAVANAMAASAAYWLSSSADEIVVTPSGAVGSIGVFAAHTDCSRMLEKLGVATSLIGAGRYKTEGNPFEPLGQAARDHLQVRVKDHYAMFVDAVARGRNVRSAAVRDGFGQGRMVAAEQAVTEGMADRVETLDETVRRISRTARKQPLLPGTSARPSFVPLDDSAFR